MSINTATPTVKNEPWAGAAAAPFSSPARAPAESQSGVEGQPNVDHQPGIEHGTKLRSSISLSPAADELICSTLAEEMLNLKRYQALLAILYDDAGMLCGLHDAIISTVAKATGSLPNLPEFAPTINTTKETPEEEKTGTD